MRLRDPLPALWGALLASLCNCWGAVSDNNVFTIRHEKNNQCIQVKNLQLLSGSCQETKETLWTWVSQHRLFSLGSQKCLGLDVSESQNRVKMVDCDSRLILWWQCADALVFSASKNKLALKDGVVTASVDSADTWRRNNSSDVICKHPYHESYTRDGNSYGKPCEFPFLYNETWHHDCIQDELFTDGEWCSTTSNFNRDGKWGLCLKQEDGCQNTWEHDANSGRCYQLNTQAALTWKEAYVSCQRQGGDLLSISNLAELNNIQGKDGIAETFWIGLNQLDLSGGWQWSDHTPLNFLSWSPEMKDSSPLAGFDCVAMSAESGQWKSYPCEIALPYVCEKQLNKTKSEFTEVQNYMETQCDSNWFPHNGFCYVLSNSSASWDDANESCKTSNTDLISIHSLADVELLVVKLHIETNDKIWTGFVNKETPAFFKWSDGSKVEFTYWDQDEPKIPSNSTPNCVAYSAELGRWSVLPCKEKLKYVCMKKGEILNETKSDKDCPSNEVWKKHGDFCYKIEKDEVSFEKNCNLTITNRFEQEFINSLIRKHVKVEEKYFWIGLQDNNSLGEYRWGSADGKSERLTYTNWNNLQPAFSGGCVAMSSGRYLGKWEVQDCKTFKAYSICKKYIGPQKEPEVLPKVTDPCPPGWLNGSGLACYKFFHKERLLRTRIWEEAERFCEALGGHLPSFTNMLEVKMLHDTLRKIISDERWVWIGLNKRNPESLGSWQWSDNKPVSAVVPYNFEDDYDTRDCAAIKIHKNIHRYYWPYLLEDREEDIYMKPFHCSSKLEWVCQITKGSSPKIPVWYKPDQDGIHGLALNIDGSEFWFEPNKHLSYQEAALYCSRNGSDLAAVTSFTALEGILNRIANLSDENQKWWLKYTPPISHSPHFYRYFSRHPYEPYFRDCAHVSPRKWSRYDLISCSTKLPFICEKVNISLLETHDPDYKPPQKSCIDGWTVFLNKCYQTVTPQRLEFGKAKEYCQSHGGMLPSIKTPAEQDFITSLLPNMPEAIWIGLSIKRHTLEKKWLDNSVLEYSNFHPLLEDKLRMFPRYWFDDINLCGVLLNDPKLSYVGTWNLTSCEETLSVAICEHEADSVKNQTQEASLVTVNYQNVTYTLILKNLTWFKAQEECLQKNMQLVSITEQYQQAFLAAQVAQHNYQLWTGLSSKDDGNNYQWSDGKHVQFSRWSNDDGDLVDDCVYLDSDGFWKTYECYSELPGAICYLPRKEIERTEEFGSIKCPHKVKNTPWIPFQNSCYAFMISKGRWKEMRSNEAHHLCKQINENASLLSIKDEKENNFVVEQLQSFGSFAQWLRLGLIYQPADGLLKWYDETHVIYNNWRLGRPSIKNNYFVAGINLDGFWDIDSHIDSRIYSHVYSHIDHHRSILACKIEMVPKEDKPPLPKKLNYGNNSYWILQKKLSWYKAWGECKQNGGDLASIHDESQQVFLEDIVKRDGFPLWFGLSIHDESQSDFEWSDESAFDYQPWEYEHSRSSGNCYYLDTKGFWNRKKCSDNVDGALCYSSLKEMQSRKTENPTACPQTTSESSWIQYKGHCYAFDMSFYNFSIYNGFEAKTVCKKLDPSATVLTIKDPEENKFVMTHLREHSFITGRVWLGLISRAKSSNWLDDGSEVKYTNWAKGRATGQCSIIFSTNGTWSQIDCLKDESRVVCKAPQVAHHVGGAIAVAMFIILAFIAGLIFFLYKKKRLQWRGFSSVRYERGMHDDETDSMFTRDGD